MKENKIVATLWRWVKRAFWGAGKEISEDDQKRSEKDIQKLTDNFINGHEGFTRFLFVVGT